MNIHPIFVHFPVALLSIYAVLEAPRFRIFNNQEYWFYLKAYLLFIGTAFSYAALYTGGMAEDLRHSISTGISASDRSAMFHLIDVHSNWAACTAIIFSFISLLYIIKWIHQSAILPITFINSNVWRIVIKINNVFFSPSIIIPLAIIGLIIITVTGALGGAIEYGPNSDPIVHLIYSIII